MPPCCAPTPAPVSAPASVSPGAVEAALAHLAVTERRLREEADRVAALRKTLAG